jgi:hypothetical protein
MSLNTEVQNSAMTYGYVFESNYPRFLPPGHGKDLYLRKKIADLSYDPDCGYDLQRRFVSQGL